MNQHPIIDKSYVYKEKPINGVDNLHEYNSVSGFWVTKDSQRPSIELSTFKKPRSKKADIETGEDQKGE